MSPAAPFGRPRVDCRGLDNDQYSFEAYLGVGPLIGSPCNKDHDVLGSIFGPLIFGNSDLRYMTLSPC